MYLGYTYLAQNSTGRLDAIRLLYRNHTPSICFDGIFILYIDLSEQQSKNSIEQHRNPQKNITCTSVMLHLGYTRYCDQGIILSANTPVTPPRKSFIFAIRKEFTGSKRHANIQLIYMRIHQCFARTLREGIPFDQQVTQRWKFSAARGVRNQFQRMTAFGVVFVAISHATLTRDSQFFLL